MLELYHSWDSFCSFKVRLCLEEKGLDWTGHHLDLMKFENLRPDYMTVNPNGLVPTLIDDGTVIVESTIINEYLDDAYPSAPLRPEDARAKARMRLWVQHEEEELFLAIRPASLNLMMKQVIGHYSEDELDAFLKHHPRQDRVGVLKKVFKAPFDADAVEKSRHRLAAAFKLMEKTLSQAPWLAGDSYSLADIAAAPAIDRIERLGMADLWENLPGTEDWITRLMARPAYQKALPLDDYRLPVASVV
jgi:glutathione S-transferase